MVDARAGAGRLAFDDVDLHVFYFNPHQEEIDFAHNHILQMVSVTKQKIETKKGEEKKKNLLQ